MPFMEFLCETCGIYFELGCDKQIDISSMICVDCASGKLKMILFDEECHFRVHRLMMDIAVINDRVETLYSHLDLPYDPGLNCIEISEKADTESN